MKIGFVPIDNRPVCYTLPKQICAIDGSMELSLPKREFLGDLTKTADIEAIFEWLNGNFDILIISLDTIAYGGLIPSRRSSDSFDEIKLRLDRLKKLLKGKKVYAFSSIMRISDNNINEEEKEYWSKWGKKIFQYSYCTDKYGTMCKKEVPDEILEDYLNTRKRNFEINKIYLDWQKEGIFETLIFSKDDCAEYGFNVQEARALESLGGYVKTGADEIPLTLLARAVKGSVRIAPIFFEPEYKNLISNYEDISIEKCVNSQIELAGCEVSDVNSADILLYVNNFVDKQGEIVMNVPTKPFDKVFEKPSKPYMIADVRYANGADNAFVQALLSVGAGENFFGYSAWNTSANTLGSLICAAKIKFLAKNYDENAFQNLQITRFLDDWAYQANARQTKLSDMKNFEERVFKFVGKSADVSYKRPWNRTFEVEIEFN